MLTGLLTSRGVMAVVETPIPSVTGPGQVLVRNLVSTICGSDIHVIFDSPVTDTHRPGYPGHESVGVIIASSDPRYAEGDLVLAVPTMIYAGGFAPYQLLPSSLVIPLPPGTDPVTAVLAQQLGTTIFAMKRFWVGSGEGTAVVLGAGPVGLCFTWLCQRAGFDHVVVSDLRPHRLRVATAMGATRVVLAAGDAVVDAVHEVAPEGARLVVEAAGKDVTRVQAVHAVAVDGRIGLFGMPEGAQITLPFETLFRRKPTVELCWDAQAEPGHPSFREAWETIRTGRIDPTPLLPRLFPLAKLPAALDAARDAVPGPVKFGIRFG